MGEQREEFADWERDEDPLSDEDALIVNLDGFEGPLDLLLALSRSRKVDLKALSIAELADQYIGYIENLKKHRLEIAADYLVMAAWLTFLKSKLLLPSDDENLDEPSGDELAARLAFRLKRLDAMRQAGNELMARPKLGEMFFGCGAPEGFSVSAQHHFKADQYALLRAYADGRQRQVTAGYKIKKRAVWSIQKARERLQSMLGFPVDWAPIQDLIKGFLGPEKLEKTTVASTFGASLELAREGEIELRQERHFQPLYVKVCKGKRDG